MIGASPRSEYPADSVANTTAKGRYARSGPVGPCRAAREDYAGPGLAGSLLMWTSR